MRIAFGVEGDLIQKDKLRTDQPFFKKTANVLGDLAIVQLLARFGVAFVLSEARIQFHCDGVFFGCF